MEDDQAKLVALLEYVTEDSRVCPQPTVWNGLWELLPNKQQVGNGWNPPLPLILAAWWDTPNLSKVVRLREQIEFAFENGALSTIDSFLRSLPDTSWHHLND